MLMEFLNFTFSSFWTWLGMMMLLAIVITPFTALLAALGASIRGR